ncbi:hypothetical protein [Anditalea andensis]|uniref:Uncharacterized protein n=1 Tax=Anditalea andensis TaxID=1048983 RepID=A0A074KP58_9BACT|nr:hypothetical protein [Anditalea andensis]KEO71721.1 hypothetical protein EL17_21280 [Anditalea andensis]
MSLNKIIAFNIYPNMNPYHFDIDFAGPEKGFSKSQILNLTYKDIERLSMMENPEISNKEEEKKKGPNDGGPRPPKEEDFPDKDPFPEVSDPNGKDN